ncbi:MAG TPA: DUF3105 domain-containing protein [Rugosimonospora sp.]|nr:DUF3105 domain-containing protein [Rugosimonospora sp.]
MSISSPQTGGERRPTAKKAVAGGKPGTSDSAAKSSGAAAAKSSAAAKSTAAKSSARARSGSTAAKSAGRPASSRPAAGKSAAGGKGGGRPPITPVKVNKGRNWGPIVLFTVVGLVAAGIIGFGAYEVHLNGLGWQSRADGITGIVDYRKTDPAMLTRNHKYGVINYKVSPPVGGDHNPNWQRCQGDVYTAQIPSENAVHALEHGAVWITYRPNLPQAEVNTLKSKVQGNDFMLMSPYPGLTSPISLQAWGFQLKVDNASDKRIDDFIRYLRQNAAMEPNTPCSTGSYVTGTGSTPYDLGQPSGAASASAPGMTKSS